MDIQQAFSELGLSPHATPTQARMSYHQLTQNWHPQASDNPQAMARLQAIHAAYEAVLAHWLARAEVATPSRPADLPVLALRDAVGSSAGFAEFDDKNGFVGARARPPLVRVLRLSLTEAARGCIKRVSATANGSCLYSAGDAEAVANSIWLADVRIPPGTLDGAQVPLSDIQIRASSFAQPRGLRVMVQLDKHPLFRLDHDRLTVTMPLSIWDWITGGDVTVPTLQGHARVTLPPHAGVLKIMQQGWPKAGQPGQRHPLYLQPRRVYPSRLDAADAMLVKELAQRHHLPEVAGWQRSLQAWMDSGL